ncbi:hypothetical protein [Polyangium sp. 6x1]|uniref:hypothetical protein n=1 Tax=Polyangium sp. 6x1 TaxID=3042689 RepID=UPI002482827E|nr:hypothetical protein [Polyangium sp. 6x1]MDI1451437.1 hypothetical protein [Polyangium sp. 6x1]
MKAQSKGRCSEGARRRRLVAAVGLVFVGLSFVACEYGERARAQGECPPGETCSELTPKGLVFIGAHTINDADVADLLATAVGGTQTVSVYYANAPSAPYVAGFEARLVDSTVARLPSPGPTTLVLRGVSEGKALLRLLEPRTSKLLDRVEIETAAVQRISVLPRELLDEKMEAGEWALLQGAPAELGIVLFGANEMQLVDESLEVRAHGAEVSRRTWDRYEVMTSAPSAVSLDVRAGDQRGSVDVQVVTSIDDITRKATEGSGEGRIEIGVGAGGETICFQAKSGRKTVVGAKWVFEPSETLTVARPDMPSDLPPWAAPPWSSPSCVKLAGTAVGDARLKVKAGEYEKVFEVGVR